MTVAVIIAVALLVAGFAVWKLKSAKGPVVRRTAEPLHVQVSPEPFIEAGVWAANYYNGRSEVTTIGKTGSMLPLLQGGEAAVLAHDFDGIRLGQIVAYRTVGGSSPALGSRLVHRIAEQTEAGWIPMGDTALAPLETWNPITRTNYIGTLVAIFRQA